MRRLTGIALLGSLLAFGLAGPGAAGSTYNVPQFTTGPQVDGTMAPGEWSGARQVPFSFYADGWRSGTIFLAHDGTNLYVGMQAVDPTTNPAYPFGAYPFHMNSFDTWFDDDADGVLVHGEDRVLTTYLGTSDAHWNPTAYPWGGDFPGDVTAGGQVDSAGAGTFQASTSTVTFEMSHELCSGDPLDFCLAAGDTVGAVWNVQAGNGSVNYDVVDNPNMLAWPLDASTWSRLFLEGDSTPPELTVDVTPSMLWPPNHRYVTVEAYVSSTDDQDPAPIVELVSVTSNEPDDAPGGSDGSTLNDVVIDDDFTFRLRAERDELGNGRVYTVTYSATDAHGNSALESATVIVPVRG